MNEYQSIELHHGASSRYYRVIYDEGLSPAIEYGDEALYSFDTSVFSGGHIAFIDDEDISFYEDNLRFSFDLDGAPYVLADSLSWVGFHSGAVSGFGPPVEIDRKYLPMILGAKKLKTSVNLNFSASTVYGYADDESATLTGTVEGSFDGLDLSIYDTFLDYNWTDPSTTRITHEAAWYRRDISSKAAQLNSLDQLKTMSEYASYDKDGSVTHPLPATGPLLWLPYRMLSSAKHALPRMRLRVGVDLLTHPSGRSYEASGETAKSGNYSGNINVSGDFELISEHGFGVGFIVVTPTKVYAFPQVNGWLHTDSAASGIYFTAVYSETYPHNYGGSLPPLGSSTMTFLGAQIPIYFYYYDVEYDDSGSFIPFMDYTASCEGTSFDISIEEDY
jgi:hypothetical protein